MRVVVIEDDVLVQQMLVTLLRMLGCEALDTSNPRECLALIERERPDVVLVDSMMPEMSGADVLVWLDSQPHLRHIPTVMMSGGSGNPWTHIEPTVYLYKPFRTQDLATTLLPFADSDVAGLMHDLIAGRIDPEWVYTAVQNRHRLDSEE